MANYGPNYDMYYAEISAGSYTLRTESGYVTTPTPEQTKIVSFMASNRDPKEKNFSAIQHIAHDPTSACIDGPCPTCGKKIVVYVLLGDGMNAVFNCTCGAVWDKKS